MAELRCVTIECPVLAAAVLSRYMRGRCNDIILKESAPNKDITTMISCRSITYVVHSTSFSFKFISLRLY